MVSEQFRERHWKVASIDNSPISNATTNMDILDVDVKNCRLRLTLSEHHLPASHTQRRVEEETVTWSNMPSKTPRALIHHKLLLKTCEILTWAKRNHPHLLVVIDNPFGLLTKKPRQSCFHCCACG